MEVEPPWLMIHEQKGKGHKYWHLSLIKAVSQSLRTVALVRDLTLGEMEVEG